MNIENEQNKIKEWQEHITELENTKTFHPFALYSCIHYWKHKIKTKEEEIIKFIQNGDNAKRASKNITE